MSNTPSATRDTDVSPQPTPLDAVVGEIRSAFVSGDLDHAFELINDNVLETWFGTNPDEFMKMIKTAEVAGQQIPALIAVIRDMMLTTAGISADTPDVDAILSATADTQSHSADSSLGASDAQVAVAPQLTLEHDYMQSMGSIYSLRLQGRPVEALQATQGTSERRQSLQTLYSVDGSFSLFRVLQEGLTAMLAGDFELAEAMFAEARLIPSLPTLPFLTRDAHSKAAVLHACFGDPSLALSELAIADQQPRTSSWLEPVLDAQSQLARALVQTDDPQQAIKIIDAIPLSALGEMWPFYAYALRVIFERAGQPSEATRRLEILDQTRLPRVDNQGFSGSVLPAILAMSALAAGDPNRARELWQRVDPNLTITKLGSAVFALSVGDARESIRIAMELRSLTRNLRQLEIWRLSILSVSLLLLEDEEACLEVLHSALGLPRGLAPEEAAVFHESVQIFAEDRLATWPHRPAGPVESFSRLSFDMKAGLTARELEVLSGLARGLSREQIASELFISVNTVKAHQQTLYRKLDVSNRTSAVIEAEQRGLL